jgi:hypothetical protein
MVATVITTPSLLMITTATHPSLLQLGTSQPITAVGMGTSTMANFKGCYCDGAFKQLMDKV